MKQEETKKPFYKKVWFWVVVVILLVIVTPKSEKVEDQEEVAATTAPVEEKKEDTSSAETEVHNVVGKDFTEITDEKPNKVNDDVTGDWRILTVAQSFNIEEYAVDYYNRNFEGNGSTEVHAIVNFTNKTTTRITDMGSQLEVTIFEYVDKEEHSAKTLFSGLLLKQFYADKETAAVEEIQ